MLSFILLSSCKVIYVSSNDVVDRQPEVNDSLYQKESDQYLNNTIDELSDSLILKFQKTPCFGQCPTFVFLVYKSGYAEYIGERWVDLEGHFKGEVSKEKLSEVMKKAKEVGFYEMDNQYDNEYVTDLPSTITTLKGESGFKVVANRYEGPELLYELEKLIDEVADSIEWEKIESKEKMNDKQ